MRAYVHRGRPNYMMRMVCKSKIHGAIVTEANLNYVGSLTIDRALMDAADILPYEWLHVVNVTSGSRFETYAIEAEAGSSTIALNGAAARLGHVGDKLIIMCVASLSDEELKAGFTPRIVFTDSQNHIVTPSVGDRAWDIDATLSTEAEMNQAMRD
jgi:aspartate 1-decarboxylase